MDTFITRINCFAGVFMYEFRMGIRRKGLWLAYGFLFLFYIFALFNSGRFLETPGMSMARLWGLTALVAFMYNLFLPVVGGISAADRMVRDRYLHVYELIQSSRLGLRDYILGKYFGTLAAISLPVLTGILLVRVYTLFLGAPAVTFGMSITTFLTVNLPAYAFITAFSLACPLVIPTRVYQVLFTGYWFWGNFVYPDMFPTLSGTVLQVSGKIPAEGLFGTVIDMGNIRLFTMNDVWVNYVVVLICINLALFAAYLFLSRERKLS